ncbi:MAG: 2,3,4,5-tetrahydropyridine-2,6-dicarboxylate N-succinyltransferase [Sphingobacteriia bacterium]|nr:2,3,4,5-tetrahydropyridine-2,6-dicarboxylate N-succinyltransferase [Sphingobacteriia bacterium]
MNIDYIKNFIETLWNDKNSNSLVPTEDNKKVINDIINLLDSGKIRIAEKINDKWQVNEFAKKAVLLYFFFNKNITLEGSSLNHFDKVPLKTSNWSETEFTTAGFRIVPGSIVRKGAFISKNVVVMPSFINIGAFIDENTMIDSMVTIGSCSQIGKNCHISEGVGIGGVLEPLQANPVIVEDNCFIGAKSVIVEGAIISEGSVLAMGTQIGASTTIIEKNSGKEYKGFVPPYSVVIPGSLKINDNLNKNCAIIIKKVDAQVRTKTQINELLRD